MTKYTYERLDCRTRSERESFSCVYGHKNTAVDTPTGKKRECAAIVYCDSSIYISQAELFS